MSMNTPLLLQTATNTGYPVDRAANGVVIRLILDSGSQKSYILVERWRLPTEQTQVLSIKTFGSDVKKIETCDIVKLGFKVISRAELEFAL